MLVRLVAHPLFIIDSKPELGSTIQEFNGFEFQAKPFYADVVHFTPGDQANLGEAEILQYLCANTNFQPLGAAFVLSGLIDQIA